MKFYFIRDNAVPDTKNERIFNAFNDEMAIRAFISAIEDKSGKIRFPQDLALYSYGDILTYDSDDGTIIIGETSSPFVKAEQIFTFNDYVLRCKKEMEAEKEE